MFVGIGKKIRFYALKKSDRFTQNTASQLVTDRKLSRLIILINWFYCFFSYLYRSTTVPVSEYHRSLRNLLSGYLLRKFKSSNGWQKLWVIFTNSCLFFFKTFEDDFPLASLPLLGYSVRQPDPSDGINKDYVFKLVFKNHVYFFRAESQYTFERYVSFETY